MSKYCCACCKSDVPSELEEEVGQLLGKEVRDRDFELLCFECNDYITDRYGEDSVTESFLVTTEVPN